LEEPTGGPRQIAALPADDSETLKDALADHDRSLYVFCYGVLGNRDDAEDAAQETFLRALRSLAGYRGQASIRTWLFRIALNVCLDAKRLRRPAESWSEQHRAASAGASSPDALALEHLRVREALRTLQPRHRALVLLREHEGWSAAEIAELMGWNVKRVRNELYKARLALADWRRSTGEGENE
jgi:RNA polymerase sigma-70 factor (ECF subfamily)